MGKMSELDAYSKLVQELDDNLVPEYDKNLQKKKPSYVSQGDWVCDKCGSQEISQSAWVNINTEKLVDFVDNSTYWCDKCKEEVNPIMKEDFKLEETVVEGVYSPITGKFIPKEEK